MLLFYFKNDTVFAICDLHKKNLVKALVSTLQCSLEIRFLDFGMCLKSINLQFIFHHDTQKKLNNVFNTVVFL